MNDNTTHNKQYSQWLGVWKIEAFCPVSKFVTMDNDEASKPPLAILPTVAHNLRNAEIHYIFSFNSNVLQRTK